MTTDRTSVDRESGGNLLKTAAILATLVSGWFAAMAASMLMVERPAAALVIFPNAWSRAALPADIRLIRGGNHTLILTSSKAGYVRRLYKAGAWLVLPSLKNGCLDLARFRTLTGNGG
ncbi:MAG: hypothetical protein ACR2O4_08580 [Hyphomicrobiaceae bacterium]